MTTSKAKLQEMREELTLLRRVEARHTDPAVRELARQKGMILQARIDKAEGRTKSFRSASNLQRLRVHVREMAEQIISGAPC